MRPPLLGDNADHSLPRPLRGLELLERADILATGAIPRNATVLVVSRGDVELLRIGPRRALHFPQDEFGGYAGYHPQDSAAAAPAESAGAEAEAGGQRPPRAS